MGNAKIIADQRANAIIVLAYALARTDFKIGPSDTELVRRWLCLTALRGA